MNIKLKNVIEMLNGKYQCHMAESCTYHLPTIISQLLNRSHIKRPNSQQKFARFLEKFIRMNFQHKNDQIKRARGLCRKTGFLHSNNSFFILSCEWIYLLKVNLKTSQESLNNEINHYFIFKELMTIPFGHLAGQSVGWRELGSSPPCSACLELWLGWHLGPAGRSGAPGVRKPLDVHQDPIHPHLSR